MCFGSVRGDGCWLDGEGISCDVAQGAGEQCSKPVTRHFNRHIGAFVSNIVTIISGALVSCFNPNNDLFPALNLNPRCFNANNMESFGVCTAHSLKE